MARAIGTTALGSRARAGARLLGLLVLGIGLARPTWAAPAFQSLSNNISVVGTSTTITIPAGAVQNDLLLATLSARGSNQTITAPSGWTQVLQQSNGSETLAVFYQVVNATTSASFTFNLGTSAGVLGSVLRYTGVDPRYPIDIAGVATGTGNPATAPAVTTAVADTAVVRVAGIGDDTLSSTPAAEQVRINYPGGSGVALGVSDAAQTPAGGTGAANFGIGNDAWVAATIALRPLTAPLCANPPGSGFTTLAGGVVNTYYPGTTTASAGAVSIEVGTPRGASTPIAAGDLLLVMQMQDAAINYTNTGSYGDGMAGDPGSGATNYNNAGRYEFVVAKGPVSGGAVPVEGTGPGGGLLYTYTNANATTTQGQRRFQVIRVPQYFDAAITGTITAAAWNGTTGGVVALDAAGTVTFSGGTIDTSTLGFRGGGGQAFGGQSGLNNTDYRTLSTQNPNGNKAEGVAGSPDFIYNGSGTLVAGGGYPNGTATNASRARGAPGNAGGGGNDGRPSNNDQNSGGGGGGNGGAGGKGGNTWSSNLGVGGFGGAAFPHAPGRLAAGGGGGSGSRNNSAGVQSSGGLGGGLILVRANAIAGAGTLRANGGWPAVDNYTPAEDGGGGGGSGGSVLVFGRTGSLATLSLQANGGIGANAWPTRAPGGFPGERHGPGGGGAGGVIYYSSASGAPATSVSGGLNGTTTTALDPFGATSGANGAVASFAEGQMPGATPGATCRATLAGVSGFRAEAEGGQVLLRWETRFEIGTLGFHVEWLNPATDAFERITGDPLPGLITSPQGGTYEYLDPDAWPGDTLTYRLVELETWGGTRVHGPYRVTALERTQTLAGAAAPAASIHAPRSPRSRTGSYRPGPGPRGPGAESRLEQTAAARSAPEAARRGHDDPRRGYRATPHALRPRQAPALDTRLAATDAAPIAAAPLAAQTQAATVTTSSRARVAVRETGLIHVSAANLASVFGIGERAVRSRVSSGRLIVKQGGSPVAWTPADGDDGILFFGQGIDSLYTLDNVYLVSRGSAGELMAATDGAPPADTDAVTDFVDTIAFEQNAFPATVVGTDPEGDYWYWDGFIGATAGWSSKGFSLDVPDVVAGGSLAIALAGASPAAHPVEVSMNGTPLGSDTWAGLRPYTLSLDAVSELQSGANSVDVRALGDSSNLFYLDGLSLTYRRLARALGDRLMLTAEADGPVWVTGYGSADIRVLDVTDAAHPVRLVNGEVQPDAGDYGIAFSAVQGRRYLVVAAGAIRTLTAEPAPDLSLRQPDQVDYVVITTPSLADAAGALADYRASTGLTTRVILLTDIYATFNDGIESPHAIRDLLRYAKRQWGTRYAVLAGLGSMDYRDLYGLGEGIVPSPMTATPFGLFACDSCLADFDGDSLPELAISRIPAATADALLAYVGKVQAYEQQVLDLGTAGVLMSADKNDPLAGRFAEDSDDIAAWLPPDVEIETAYLDDMSLASARQTMLGRLGGDLGWLNYIGHGGVDRLAGAGLLTTADVAGLGTSGRLPVLSALSCAVNRFEIAGYESLGEALVMHPDGGVIASWAPTGLSLNEPAARMNASLFDVVFNGRSPVLGDAILEALQDNAGGATYMNRIYTLLGDAALRLTP